MQKRGKTFAENIKNLLSVKRISLKTVVLRLGSHSHCNSDSFLRIFFLVSLNDANKILFPS